MACNLKCLYINCLICAYYTHISQDMALTCAMKDIKRCKCSSGVYLRAVIEKSSGASQLWLFKFLIMSFEIAQRRLETNISCWACLWISERETNTPLSHCAGLLNTCPHLWSQFDIMQPAGTCGRIWAWLLLLEWDTVCGIKMRSENWMQSGCDWRIEPQKRQLNFDQL